MNDVVTNCSFHETDILIVGGGAAGCYAAITAARLAPDLKITVLEKANIKRSGCLAAGINALNAYITDGYSPEEYLEYVRWDAEKIVRDDLVLSMSKRFNQVAEDLENMGLVILKDESGRYVSRGKRNIKINGENIKPILARETRRYANVEVFNHVNVADLVVVNGCAVGVVGFSVDCIASYVVSARAILIACGGAAGLYRPNNPGFSRHKLWYCPFNVGSGYAMGIRSGAEMTSLEMRFVAQRCKDTIAPTGTLALGVGAKEINALGETYGNKYGYNTSARAYGATKEASEGRGPCYLKTVGITADQEKDLWKAYLNMAPAQTLKWIESEESPTVYNVQIEGTEPYVVGGHTGSGYWVDTWRRTTIRGLYAAGDVVGGAPKKFATGAMAEGAIAAETMIKDLKTRKRPSLSETTDAALDRVKDYERRLTPRKEQIYTTDELEEGMQKIMDEYAGGVGAAYRYNSLQLKLAKKEIRRLQKVLLFQHADDMDELLRVYELKDRLTVCLSLIAHMEARHETRWPGFGVNSEYPESDANCEFFVNSRVVDGEIEILHHPLNKGETVYEHSY